MTKHRKITSIAGLVKAFGGTRGLSEWAGVGMSAISNWVERDQIPPGWHYRLHIEAKNRGFEIEPAVFGLIADGRCADSLRLSAQGRAA